MQSRNNNSKAIYLIIIVVTVTIILSYTYWIPYFNHYLKTHQYQYPNKNENFVINTEAITFSILKIAFYDRNVIIDNKLKPNLIVQSVEFRKKLQSKHNAPYIIVSGERYNSLISRMRNNGPPFIEIVSRTPTRTNQLYFPFIAWSGIEPERIFKHDRNKFLVYINSNCTKMREKLFKIIKTKNASAEALGKCSNTGKRAEGRWIGLDKIYSNYNFAFAIENNKIPGYITEKIINIFRGGAIPIYWGDSKTISKYFNPKSFIDISDFSSLEEAANFILELNNNPEKIRKMRQEPIFANNIKPNLFEINNKSMQTIIYDAARIVRKEYLRFIS